MDAVLATGWISQEGYVRALAASCGAAVVSANAELEAQLSLYARRNSRFAPHHPLFVNWRGQPAWLIVSTVVEPRVVLAFVSRARAAGAQPVLIDERSFNRMIEFNRASIHINRATVGLKRHYPGFSAARPGPAWQRNTAAMIIGCLAGGMVAFPQGMLAIAAVLLTLPFLGTVFVRIVALAGLIQKPRRSEAIPASARDSDLPRYSILVALYDEAQVLPKLIDALAALDYPAAKLDCLLVIEEADIATHLGLLSVKLPNFMRVVVVPEGTPQTKPRALNYAMLLARGDYVVIYDAEDRPEVDQLRRALDVFAAHGPNLACVQSCLNIYNSKQSWLTRQFTVEYSALFDTILPALQWMRLPMPLGGTSNHFPRRILQELHGWDPYNVTEDADLGIRIARLGYDVAVIPSTTWEEAPVTFKLWRNQRTRWVKGWIQTYLVHTRRPVKLARDLGFFRALGFHAYMGGLILSALVHPLFYLAVVADLSFGLDSVGFSDVLGRLFWGGAIGNLVTGYVVSVAVGVIAVRRRGHRLTLSALAVPIYWLFISFAAYRALWQLYWDPFRWEKTPHGLAQDDDTWLED